MKERFKFKALWGMATETEPKIKEIKFGDGYSQRMQDGINHIAIKATPTVRLRKRDKASIDELEGFLRRHGGYKSFEWLQPGKTEPILVICRKWTFTDNGVYVDYELPFEQVFN
ncbi:phage tail protein [Aggregatibacter actinomycetemcomitans]|uniref:phage tail protein n=1 Tax=Aggregatibacter actinomycetemcomitans TaxID=714 RepID=UPI0021512268|nr:phage tail protein [Aggregatibacter actinomycetemcomitans]